MMANDWPNKHVCGIRRCPTNTLRHLPITDYLVELLDRPIPAEMRQMLPSGFTDLHGHDASLAELLGFRLLSMATEGSLGAITTVLDRVEGKAPQGGE